MRNHQVTKRQALLKEDGSLQEPGYSTSLVQEYHRRDIKAAAFKIKEWDYYLVLNKDFGFAFTISDDGYIGLQSVSILDFAHHWEHTETILRPFPMGKLHMPSTSKNGVTSYHDKRLHMDFTCTHNQRRIQCKFDRFYQGKSFTCDIILEQPEMDSMVIAIPWKEKKNAFYYNQKINCMRASGKATFDGIDYCFDPSRDFGTLDWGRGVWTYDNTWYWGSGNGIVDGKPFGFNVGYGFGDTSAASENMLFYDGVAHKLDDIEFVIPSDHMQPWMIASSDHRFDMLFTPSLDRAARTNAIIIETDQHQVFGYINGEAVLDDGSRLQIKDLLCFAEFVHNRY